MQIHHILGAGDVRVRVSTTNFSRGNMSKAVTSHPLIFNSYIGIVLEGGYIYELEWREVTFDRLSDKGKLKALHLGYSPATRLPGGTDGEIIF